MKEEEIAHKTAVVTKKARGKHLNQFVLYSTYIVLFSIIAVFLMLSFFSIDDVVVIKDMWPFIFFIVVLIFCSVMVVQKVKTESKRTVQRDMRRM